MRQRKSMVGRDDHRPYPDRGPGRDVPRAASWVDANGIWIECQGFTDELMQKCLLSTSITTPTLCVPFARIEFALWSLRSLALSEKLFGLEDVWPYKAVP